ncbi:HD domain-containing protein [Chimaeribacter arupi]|uniref:HD domain-containing protein n=2 Tax=Yersiniaceae TaxID=1903411 RepID=A0A2N5EMW3_9GAMM|nr:MULTISPECIES: HD domain-containing protein [Yersiniaceae]MBS0971320.1 HD domain-containing protein [Nissabacter archeti]MDV5141397.1 HD domain-containing protein [Chimaeribacter arupi]PLR35679.1 HD domain-containing protein [Chimaeribacter arupi]PLR43650.1 HD domain-containing protein [Chimaeribacter arupi]PLR45751.1 HD domain-containing protein [Chimaeribacter arupi]
MSLLSPALDFGSMTEVFHFLMEIDKLKTVERRTKVLGTTRHENSAEHSWHFAVAAMTLAPYAGEPIDLPTVIQMALLHDIVEIDAGDVLVYDLAGRAAVQEKEQAAAVRLFGLLPEPQSSRFLALWHEYEQGETPEARFALLIDRVLPVIMNLNNQGQSWVENGVRLEQVLNRNAFIGEVHPELWRYLETHLQAAHQQGWLK